MTPGSCPLALYRGDTRKFQFVLYVDAGKTEPADLTGVTVKAEIRDRPGGAKIFPFTCAIETPNIINAELAPSVSRGLPSKGVWDLQLTYAGGEVVTVLAGPVTATADVTDSTAPIS